MENRNRKRVSENMSRVNEKNRKLSEDVKPLKDRNSQSTESKPSETASHSTVMGKSPTVVVECESKPQKQLTMRERLEIWKEEKKRKKEMELKSKPKIQSSNPPPTQKKAPPGKITAVDRTTNKLDRRSTFSIKTKAGLSSGHGGTGKTVASKSSLTHIAAKTGTSRPVTESKTIDIKKPKVSVKKPVLIVASRKPSQQTACAWSTNVGLADKRRHSSMTRRRLSAGMSKRPVGILKRKSCVVTAASTASVPDQSAEGPTTDHSRVKFLSPNQTPTQNHTAFRKTPAKQESMRHKLNCWLEAKGKTPSKFRHLMCFDAAMSEKKKKDKQMTRSITVEQLSEQQEKMATEDSVRQNLMSQFNQIAKASHTEVADSKMTKERKNNQGIAEQLDDLLKECHRLIETGCPTDTLLTWLKNIYDNIPLARYYTPYYRCKVEAVRKNGRFTDVTDIMSEAIKNSAQPPSDLADLNASVMRELLNQASVPAVIIDTAEQSTETQNASSENRGMEPLEKPKTSVEDRLEESKGKLVDKEPGAPFTVQYCVSNVTPFKTRKRAASLSTPHTQTVVTPVRRSMRRSVQGNIPDSEKIVRSISELSEQEKNAALYRPNHALDDVLETYQ